MHDWANAVCVYVIQYFMYKLRNTNISGSDSWQNASCYVQNQRLYESYLEVAALVPAVVFVFLNIVIARWWMLYIVL